MMDIENHPTTFLPLIFARDADGFTRTAWQVVRILCMAMTVVLPIAWIVKFVGVILKHLTFGLYLIAYSILWMPSLWLLLGTSWLWLRYWPLRPVLIIPGIVFALAGHFILMCSPGSYSDAGDRDALLWQVSYTEDWPLSWRLWQASIGGDYSDADNLQT